MTHNPSPFADDLPFYVRENDAKFEMNMETITSRKISLELIQDARATLADARRLLEHEPSDELFKVCTRLAEVEGVLMDILITEGNR